jgi:hypothetical protein
MVPVFSDFEATADDITDELNRDRQSGSLAGDESPPETSAESPWNALLQLTKTIIQRRVDLW